LQSEFFKVPFIAVVPKEGVPMLTKQNLFGQNDRLRREPPRPGFNGPGAPAAEPAPEAPVAPVAAAPAEPAPAPVAESRGSKLIVGPDIKLKGAEITDCDTLVVEGRVEASMDSRVIQIAENGSFHGTVGIDVAEIRGRFDGDLTARKQLVIHATGRVSGKIRYGSIVVEQGAELAGDVGTLKAPAAPAQASILKPPVAAAT
jgi:cytoskeletal protein CcmA (bactofilin family)